MKPGNQGKKKTVQQAAHRHEETISKNYKTNSKFVFNCVHRMETKGETEPLTGRTANLQK